MCPVCFVNYVPGLYQVFRHPYQRAVPSRNACTLLIEVERLKRLVSTRQAVGSAPATQHLKVPGRDMRLDGVAVMQLPVGSRAIRNLMSAGTGLIAASRQPKSTKKGNSLHWKTSTNN